MNYRGISGKFELASKICAVAVAPAIVLSTAAVAILFPLTVLLNLLAGNLREKFNLSKRNPVALVSLLFFSLFLIGATYSTASTTDILMMLRKYAKYALAVMFIPIFVEEKWRDYAIFSFMGAILVMLIASYLRTHGYLGLWARGSVEVFKISMVFNFLMAFAAYLCLIKITSTSRYRLMWITFLILIVHTVLFRSMGRSGYFVFAGLMALFFVQKLGWRGLVAAATGIVLLCGLAFAFSSTFKGRINAVFNEVKIYQQNDNTSVGLRMTFVKNSMKLIKIHPILGTGTGSYIKEYSAIDPNNGYENPHNEYAYITVQFGILGLMILLLFFAIPLWYSQFLPEKEKYIARGIVISVMIGSLANCWLFDITVRCSYAYFVMLAFATLPVSSRNKGSSLYIRHL